MKTRLKFPETFFLVKETKAEKAFNQDMTTKVNRLPIAARNKRYFLTFKEEIKALTAFFLLLQ